MVSIINIVNNNYNNNAWRTATGFKADRKDERSDHHNSAHCRAANHCT